MDVTPQAAVSAITASRVEASLSLGRTPIGATGSNDLLGHLRNSHGRFQCGDPAENRARCRSADRRDGANIRPAIALPMRREHALGGESVSVERILEQRDVRTWFLTLLESARLTPDERTLELATTVFSHLASDKLSGWHLYLARISDRPSEPAPCTWGARPVSTRSARSQRRGAREWGRR